MRPPYAAPADRSSEGAELRLESLREGPVPVEEPRFTGCSAARPAHGGFTSRVVCAVRLCFRAS